LVNGKEVAMMEESPKRQDPRAAGKA